MNNNVYELTCKVTGQVMKTTPIQFNHLVALYNTKLDGTTSEIAITANEVRENYVSRDGRNVLRAEKLSPSDAKAKYGIHDNVLAHLVCFKVKPLGKRAQKKLDDAEAAKKAAEAAPTTTESTPSPEEVVFVAPETETPVTE